MYKIFAITLILTISSVNAGTALWPRSDYSCGGTRSTLTRSWDTQKCEDCSTDYCACQSYWTCDDCIDDSENYNAYGYYTDDQFSVKMCRSCTQDGVKKCCFYDNINSSKAVRAEECFTYPESNKQAYLLGGSACWTQGQCQTYEPNLICSACYEGYYLDENNLCVTCNLDNCAACNGLNHCTTCKEGFYMQAYDKDVAETSATKDKPYNCYACTQYCACSNKDNKCESCLSGYLTAGYYYDSTAKSCKTCSEANCLVCANDKCTQCGVNGGFQYMVDSDGKCQKCTQNQTICHTCDQLSGTNVYCNTTGCNNGYFWKKNDNDDFGTCKKCSEGTSPFKGDTGLARCNDAGSEITQCDEFETTGYTRAPHPTAYYLIQKEGDDGAQHGHCVLNKNNCRLMKTNLAKADTDALCDTCYDQGYDGQLWRKNEDTNICIQCSSLNTNLCIDCEYNATDKKVQCNKCIDQRDATVYDQGTTLKNYIINTETHACDSCITNCYQCSDSKTCTTCMSGYYADGDTKCTKCLTNCKVCTNGTSCSECFSGYRPYDNSGTTVCQPCDQWAQTGGVSRCIECSSDRKTCTKCMSNYHLTSAGACIQPRDNCVKYGDNGECVACDYANRVVDGYCRTGYGNGYVNLPSGCTSDRYVRDDDVLTASFESANILLFNLLALIVCAMILIF